MLFSLNFFKLFLLIGRKWLVRLIQLSNGRANAVLLLHQRGIPFVTPVTTVSDVGPVVAPFQLVFHSAIVVTILFSNLAQSLKITNALPVQIPRRKIVIIAKSVLIFPISVKLVGRLQSRKGHFAIPATLRLILVRNVRILHWRANCIAMFFTRPPLIGTRLILKRSFQLNKRSKIVK